MNPPYSVCIDIAYSKDFSHYEIYYTIFKKIKKLLGLDKAKHQLIRLISFFNR